MTVISVDHVSKRYPLKNQDYATALDDVTLQVKEGDTVAIVGPSGSGKTTLLRIIAGLETPDSGQVRHDDILINDVPETTRGIGMVFQNYALIPQWKVRENIGFYLRLRHRQSEVPERVEQVAKITGVGVGHLMGRFPRELSGGEKQRVAIARAFARDLRLLIFDEPFANLDAKFRMSARLEARRLLNQFPVTLIYVTHDQQEASMMAEKVVIMRAGQIEQLGSYQYLYDNPCNTFVAQFIGVPTMNLFEGLVESGAWKHAHLGAYPVQMPNHPAVTMGIRPQHIHLDGDIRAFVKAVTPHYAERYHLLDVTIQDLEFQVQVPLEMAIEKGTTITCRFDRQAMYFFNSLTGECLF